MNYFIYFLTACFLLCAPHIKALPFGWYVGLKGGMSQFSGNITSEYTEDNQVYPGEVPFIPTAATSSKINKTGFMLGVEGGYIFPINDVYFWGTCFAFDPAKRKKNHTRWFKATFSDGISTVDVNAVVQEKIVRGKQYMGNFILGRRWDNGMAVYGQLGVTYANYKYSFTRTETTGAAEDIFCGSEHKDLWGIVPALGVSYALSDRLTLALEMSYALMQTFKGSDLDPDQDVLYKPRIKSNNLQGTIVVRYHF